jgi:hypothetical protein
MKNVVQDWVGEGLTLKQQTVVLSAIRGCDGAPKDDLSKPFVRALRSTVLKNAVDGECSFMGSDIDSAQIKRFLKALDPYPMHWLLHFTHAVECVGYGHPDHVIAKWWDRLYCDICHALHFKPEDFDAWDHRLRDGPPSDCWKA